MIVGRTAELETPVESRSLWERQRDTGIALRLVAEQPLTGVGLGQYLPAARRYDAWAEVARWCGCGCCWLRWRDVARWAGLRR